MFKGEEMTRLCQTLAAMEEAIVALERRGIGLRKCTPSERTS